MSISEGMTKIKIDPSRYLKKHATNEIWLLAAEISQYTHEEPKRWLRLVKRNQWAAERALIDLKEGQARKPAALFLFLFKKYSDLNK